MPREPVHRWDDFFLNGPQASDEFLPAPGRGSTDGGKVGCHARTIPPRPPVVKHCLRGVRGALTAAPARP